MTNRLGLHRLPGPSLSVDMLLVELLDHIKSIHCFLPVGRPLAHGTWRFMPGSLSSDAWLSSMDNPLWETMQRLAPQQTQEEVDFS